MACILEQRGYKKITVYLLDTIIKDKYLIGQFNKQNTDAVKQSTAEYMAKEGYEKDYIDKVMLAMSAELEVSKQPITGKLMMGKVFLFKALEEDLRIDYVGKGDVWKYTALLKDNNIKPFAQMLTIISVPCHHGNVLQEPVVSKVIMSRAVEN